MNAARARKYIFPAKRMAFIHGRRSVWVGDIYGACLARGRFVATAGKNRRMRTKSR